MGDPDALGSGFPDGTGGPGPSTQVSLHPPAPGVNSASLVNADISLLIPREPQITRGAGHVITWGLLVKPGCGV